MPAGKQYLMLGLGLGFGIGAVILFGVVAYLLIK
jgi:hypothetical protein